MGNTDVPEQLRTVTDTLDPIRAIVAKTATAFIVTGGYAPPSAREHWRNADDLVAFGRHFKGQFSYSTWLRTIFEQITDAAEQSKPAFQNGFVTISLSFLMIDPRSIRLVRRAIRSEGPILVQSDEDLQSHCFGGLRLSGGLTSLVWSRYKSLFYSSR